MSLDQLIEVVMDLGRPPEARFPDGVVRLSTHPVNHDDLSHTLALVGDFTEDNRAGIERTLHRISAIRNRKGKIIGMTIRVGRAIYGTIEILRDLIEIGDNILFLGRPGVGKTTKLREVARVLADDLHKRVIIIDTSNEIAGDGDIPHPGIGAARRMQVPRPDRQHAVMIEAVENHMPEVIIVDEIGTEAEAAAARTIAERGVQLIGTAHGNTLENLIMNPTLSDLVGGVQTVTLGDEEARRRRTTKTVNERKSPPTFGILIEMASRDDVIIHNDTAKAVDTILRGFVPSCERRRLAADGHVEVKERHPERNTAKEKDNTVTGIPPISLRSPRLYLHGVKKDLVERVTRELGLTVRFGNKPERADVIIGLRSRTDDQGLKQLSRVSEAPVHLIKRNTTAEIRRLLQRLFNIVQGVEDKEIQEALLETKSAIEQVREEGVEVALPPRRSALRKVQHRMITGNGLESTSVGCDPKRHLVVYPARS
jgi:stage III sporulation protein SpoIIIAA